jgi:hypothetical protein
MPGTAIRDAPAKPLGSQQWHSLLRWQGQCCAGKGKMKNQCKGLQDSQDVTRPEHDA